jgi:hypothetical protein
MVLVVVGEMVVVVGEEVEIRDTPGHGWDVEGWMGNNEVKGMRECD